MLWVKIYTSILTTTNTYFYYVKYTLCDIRCYLLYHITNRVFLRKIKENYMDNKKSPSTSILNKLYTADIVDDEFQTDDGKTRNFNTLELGIKINGQKRKLSITLPTRSNNALVLLAAQEKPTNLLEDDEIM